MVSGKPRRQSLTIESWIIGGSPHEEREFKRVLVADSRACVFLSIPDGYGSNGPSHFGRSEPGREYGHIPRATRGIRSNYGIRHCVGGLRISAAPGSNHGAASPRPLAAAGIGATGADLESALAADGDLPWSSSHFVREPGHG